MAKSGTRDKQRAENPIQLKLGRAERRAKLTVRDSQAPETTAEEQTAAHALHEADPAEAIKTASIEIELAEARATWAETRANQPADEADPTAREAARQRAEAAKAAAAQALETRITNLQTSLTNEEARLEALQASDEPKQGDITKQQQKVALLRDTLEAAIEERDMPPEQLASHRARRALEARIADLNKKLQNAQTYLAVLQSTQNPNEQEINKQTGKIAQLEKDLASATSERDMTPEQIAALRAAEMEQLTRQKNDLAGKLREQQEKLQQQRDAIATAQAQEKRIPNLKAELQTAQEAQIRSQEKIHAENVRLGELTARITKLEAELNTAQTELGDVPVITPEQLAEQEREAKAAARKISDLANQLHQTNRQLDRLEKQTRPPEAATKAEKPREAIDPEALKQQLAARRAERQILNAEYTRTKNENNPNSTRLRDQLSALDKRIAKDEKKLRRIDPSAVEAQKPAPQPKPAPRPRAQKTPPPPAAAATPATETQAPPPPPAEPQPAPIVTTAAPKPDRPSFKQIIRKRAKQRQPAPLRADAPASWVARDQELAKQAAAAAAATQSADSAIKAAAAPADEPPAPAVKPQELTAYEQLCIEVVEAQKAAEQAQKDFDANTGISWRELAQIMGRAKQLEAQQATAKKVLGEAKPTADAATAEAAEPPVSTTAPAPAQPTSHVARETARRATSAAQTPPAKKKAASRGEPPPREEAPEDAVAQDAADANAQIERAWEERERDQQGWSRF